MNSIILTFSIVTLALVITLVLLILNNSKTKKILKENEIRLRTMIESNPECVKLQAEDGTVIEMNSAGLSLLEIDDPASIIGQSIYEFIPIEFRDSYKALTERVFKGTAETEEFKFCGQNGTECWLESNAVPIRNNSGEIVSMLAITRDITEQKTLQNKLRKRQMDLDHVCRINTIGEVTSGIAHELNQPLCAISSYAETCNSLLRSNKHTKLEETLELISDQAQRASQIVTWIRDLAKKKEPKFSTLEIEELLNDVHHIVSYYLEQNKVELSLNIKEGLPDMIGDRIQIEQALINLIQNAVDSLSAKFGKRILKINVDQDINNKIVIRVIDNGSGISKEDRANVINPYFSTKKDGLGMGLSICTTIIKAHHGKLWIENSNDTGTTIAFNLDAHQSELNNLKYG